MSLCIAWAGLGYSVYLCIHCSFTSASSFAGWRILDTIVGFMDVLAYIGCGETVDRLFTVHAHLDQERDRHFLARR